MEDYVLSPLISFQEITICLSAPCSSWSGTIKVWSMPQITRVATLKGHKERATDVAFSPADDFLATASAYDVRIHKTCWILYQIRILFGYFWICIRGVSEISVNSNK
jgi:WD40 repeat protein